MKIVIIYDNRTGLMIHTDQLWPSVHSNCKGLAVIKDGSVDVLFGPKAPPGKESNWVQTIRAKNWHMLLRFYDPLESWSDKNWKPDDIKVVIQFSEI